MKITHSFTFLSMCFLPFPWAKLPACERWVPRRHLCLQQQSHGPLFVPTAILGMHTLMSNQQYYQALGSSSIVNKEGLNSEYTALLDCHPLLLLGPGTGSQRALWKKGASSCILEPVLPHTLACCRFYAGKCLHHLLWVCWDLMSHLQSLLHLNVMFSFKGFRDLLLIFSILILPEQIFFLCYGIPFHFVCCSCECMCVLGEDRCQCLP